MAWWRRGAVEGHTFAQGTEWNGDISTLVYLIELCFSSPSTLLPAEYLKFSAFGSFSSWSLWYFIQSKWTYVNNHLYSEVRNSVLFLLKQQNKYAQTVESVTKSETVSVIITRYLCMYLHELQDMLPPVGSTDRCVNKQNLNSALKSKILFRSIHAYCKLCIIFVTVYICCSV
jgi:hypothetical protein